MAAEEDDDSHIIASVRRILGEDASRPRPAPPPPAASDVFELEPGMMIESGPPPAKHGATTEPREELSPDMAAWASEWAEEEEPGAAAPAAAHVAEPHVEPATPAPAETTSGRPPPAPAPVETRPAETRAVETAAQAGQATGRQPEEMQAEGLDEPILEPRAADAAGHAFGSLRDTLRAQRNAATGAGAAPGLATRSHAGGPTIEEMIRQELRPVLKSWLDSHLPEVVERIVRTEIARIVERGGD